MVAQVIRSTAVAAVMILCKTVGFLAGRCPAPRPSLGDGGCELGHFLARAGRALPRNPRDGKGSLRSAHGQTLAVPQNPG